MTIVVELTTTSNDTPIDVRRFYTSRMTVMASVRMSDDEAAALQREVERSKSTASELLRAGLRAVLARAAAERDAIAYAASPFLPTELIDPDVQLWLETEDWSAWEQ